LTTTRRLFGTDGIRGRANQYPMTPDLAMRVGMAAGLTFKNGDRHRVVIGKDTRLSSYMIENALTAGFLSVGLNVLLTGPIPTPGIAMLTRSMRCDLGVMISASHNPHEDNGIKLFGPDGFKLSDATEAEIETLVESDLHRRLAEPKALGRAKRIDGAQERYVEYAKRTLPRDLSLEGMRVVIDGANGAGYAVAPQALAELGAEVFAVGVTPDGFNINREVGSTSPAALVAEVKARRADIGIALDGDADRVVLTDEKGNFVDGDQLLAVIAASWAEDRRLAKPAIVVSVMSNLGLERYLKGIGVGLIRAPVGDRYVTEAMRETGCNLGGEQSGHIIMTDYTTTGDGLVAALQLLAVVKKLDRPVSEICHRFEPVPQVLEKVPVANGKSPLENGKVKDKIAAARGRLAERGRLVVRASGTEPVIRVMAEGDDRRMIEEVVAELVAALREASAAPR
jgi:phosphoglucosamine mutase